MIKKRRSFDVAEFKCAHIVSVIDRQTQRENIDYRWEKKKLQLSEFY